MMIRRFFHLFLDFIYPRDCIFCKEPVDGSGYICTECYTKIDFSRNASCRICAKESPLEDAPDYICSDCLKKRPAYTCAFVACRFENQIRELVILFKYYQGSYLTSTLAEILTAHYNVYLAPSLQIDYIVPVPVAPERFHTRGYNQALLLAQTLAQSVNLPVAKKLLLRRRSPSQTKLNARLRRANAAASFYLRGSLPESYQGKTILLIDDIMTTGSTFDACARLLKQAGVGSVYTLALGRGVMQSH